MAGQPSSPRNLQAVKKEFRRCQTHSGVTGHHFYQAAQARCTEVQFLPKQPKPSKVTTAEQRREYARVFSERVRRRNLRKLASAQQGGQFERRIGEVEEGLKQGRDEGLKQSRQEDLNQGRDEDLKQSRQEDLNQGRDAGDLATSKLENESSVQVISPGWEIVDAQEPEELKKMETMTPESANSFAQLLSEMMENLANYEEEISALQVELKDLRNLIEDSLEFSPVDEEPLCPRKRKKECHIFERSNLRRSHQTRNLSAQVNELSQEEGNNASEKIGNHLTLPGCLGGHDLSTFSADNLYWKDLPEGIACPKIDLWTAVESIVLPDIENFVACIRVGVNAENKAPGRVYFSPAYEDESEPDEFTDFSVSAFHPNMLGDYSFFNPNMMASTMIDKHAMWSSQNKIIENSTTVMHNHWDRQKKQRLNEMCILITVRREGLQSLNLVAVSTEMEWILSSGMSTKQCFGMNLSDALQSGASKITEAEAASTCGIIHDQVAKQSDIKENSSLVRQIICRMDLLRHYNTAGSCESSTVWTIAYCGHDFQLSATIFSSMVTWRWRNMNSHSAAEIICKPEEKARILESSLFPSLPKSSNALGRNSEQAIYSSCLNQGEWVLATFLTVVRTLQICTGISILIQVIGLTIIRKVYGHLELLVDCPISEKEKKNASLAHSLYDQVRKRISAINLLRSRRSSTKRFKLIRRCWRSAKGYFVTSTSSGSEEEQHKAIRSKVKHSKSC